VVFVSQLVSVNGVKIKRIFRSLEMEEPVVVKQKKDILMPVFIFVAAIIVLSVVLYFLSRDMLVLVTPSTVMTPFHFPTTATILRHVG